MGIVGTGTIGASWAALFLARGWLVRCTDPGAGAGGFLRDYVARAWPVLSELGATTESFDRASERLSFHADVESVADGASFIQESGPERIDLKRRLYAQLEDAAPADAVIASSTSGLMPSDLQSEMRNPERFLVGHPFNPPHLIPLVEVVGGRLTSPSAIERAIAIYATLGKRPIHVRKEVPGHIANRLQAALWREAVHLVAEGVADVADIDAAVVAGPGLRWAIMGPHMTFHLGGGDAGLEGFIDHLGPAVRTWWDDLGEPTIDAGLKQKLAAGVADEAAGQGVRALGEQRDRQLVHLLKTVSPIS